MAERTVSLTAERTPLLERPLAVPSPRRTVVNSPYHRVPGFRMSDDPEATHERAVIQRMMRRLDGFARGLGLDDATARRIVEQVLADMPVHTDEERLTEARHRLIASD